MVATKNSALKIAKTAVQNDVVEIELRPGDMKWGYPFAVKGLMSMEETCEFLGGLTPDTIEDIYREGRIRKGKKPGGQKVGFCRRSVMEYGRSWEI